MVIPAARHLGSRALGILRSGGIRQGEGGVLTVQVALADPGCVLSVDELVAAAAHQLRRPQVHVVADSKDKGHREEVGEAMGKRGRAGSGIA